MPSTKFTLLACHQCGWRWIYRGSLYRAQCSKCKTWVKTGIGGKSTKIDKKFLNGNILKTMDQMGINPFATSSKFLGDAIIDLLSDSDATSETLLALGDAKKHRRQSSKTIIRKAVNEWLEKEGYLPRMGCV